jgi:hypothetical protein
MGEIVTRLEDPVDEAAVGSLLGALLGGMGGAFGAAFLVAVVSATIGIGMDFVSQACAAISASLAGVLLSRAFAQHVRPWRWTIVWLLVGAVFAATLSEYIGFRFSWPYYRWALGGATLGIFFGAEAASHLCTRGHAHEIAGKGAVYLSVALLIGAGVKVFTGGRLGTTTAGIVGGTCTGLFVGWILQEVGGREASEQFGNRYAITLTGGVAGSLGGLAGAWSLWRRRHAALEPTPAEQDAGVIVQP